MIKQFKFKGANNTIWFTCCPHIFHTKPFIWQKRGYNSFEEHANDIVHIINSYVKKDDTLFVLGDGFLNSTEEQVKKWWKRINCDNIKYVFGNHEGSMKKIYKQEIINKHAKPERSDDYLFYIEIYPLKVCDDKVEILGNYVEANINNKDISLIWNNSQHGSWNLHSHNHGSYKESLPDFPLYRRLDCGWDVFKRPINFQEILNIMAKKQIAQLDHHDAQTN
jgi:calcineurin-like phosphoesterase family protein